MTSEVSVKIFKFSNDERRKGILSAKYIKSKYSFSNNLFEWENIHLLV